MAKSGDDTAMTMLAEASATARQAGAPLLVHVVANGVRGDSRVIKSAQVSAAQGFATLVLGTTSDDHAEALHVEGVTAVLLPYGLETQLAEVVRRWRQRAASIPAMRALRNVNLLVRGRRPTGLAKPVRGGGTKAGEPRWASIHPVYLNINVAFAGALDALQPDMVHVHDTVPLPSAIAHVAGRRVRGGKVRTLYDSHECVPELIKSFPDGSPYQAMGAIEREFIRDADVVTTVSGEIATVLKKAYRLRDRPGVVTNAPPATRNGSAPNLRTAIGLPDEVPLAVYSGWVAPERGLGTVVRALPKLPDLHLAIVANRNSRATVAIVKLARNLGVADRVHFAGYVPPGQVTQYLASAHVGLIPRKPGGHLDLSLPTKFREFLHAGLPIVASSNKAMAREIRATGVGEVFKAGSVAGFTKVISEVLDDPEPYRRAITPELLEKHSWEAQARVLRETYARLSHPAPRPDVVVDLASGLRMALGDRYVQGVEAFLGVANPKLLAVNLGIGRANSAGQAYYWAEAVAAHVGVPAQSFGVVREITRSPHVVVPRTGTDPAGAAAELRRVLLAYSHVLIDGYKPLFGRLLGDDIEAEIAVLRRGGVSVALAAHGTDVRDPEAHLARVPESYFAHVPGDWLDRYGNVAARNREIARTFQEQGGRLFVSTPDLLNDLPGATWLPLVVDLDAWSGMAPIVERRKPRVLHRPSRSVPPIKGSEVIVPVLERLHERGIIDHLVDRGQVPASEMPGLIEGADIVIDQIRTGSYGAAAVEAMAAGRVVVGNLSTDVRERVDDSIPIVDGPPEHLEDVLVSLAEDPDRRLRLAEQGRAYAAKWHSGELSAQVLKPYVED